MQSDHKTELMGKSLAELERLAAGWGMEAFRGRQLFHWVYGREALRFPQMSDLPRPFRERLEESCQINLPKISRRFFSEDGAVRYLLELGDGATVETVFHARGAAGYALSVEPGRLPARLPVLFHGPCGRWERPDGGRDWWGRYWLSAPMPGTDLLKS